MPRVGGGTGGISSLGGNPRSKELKSSTAISDALRGRINTARSIRWPFQR
jgi:hypothetical protein